MRVFVVVGRDGLDERAQSGAPIASSIARSDRALASVADDADELAVRAQRDDVLRDVGGAAERVAAVAHANDGHGRLGRDALDVAAR